MKKFFMEYINIIAYTITGLTFGLSFFLIFINFYHYKDVNITYKKQESDYQISQEMKDKLSLIKQNIDSFNINTYKGTQDPYSLVSIKSKLDVCVSKINTDEFSKILSKEEISIKDVYHMQQFYQTNISNECIVKQLFELANTDNKSRIKIDSLNSISPFIEDNTNQLINSTDYVQKVIKNNSSYSFSSQTTKNELYEQTKDSYYAILNSYRNAIDYIYDISNWYKSAIGG